MAYVCFAGHVYLMGQYYCWLDAKTVDDKLFLIHVCLKNVNTKGTCLFRIRRHIGSDWFQSGDSRSQQSWLA